MPDRWPYFLQRLGATDDAWQRLSIGALVRIQQATNTAAVSAALAGAMLAPPAITGSAYGWLLATARALQAEGVA